MMNITLLSPGSCLMEMTSADPIWLTGYPLKVREGEILVIEALGDDARNAFWDQFELAELADKANGIIYGGALV